MSIQSTAYDVGPIEPFNDRTRLKAEISRRVRAEIGDTLQGARSEASKLSDELEGDFYDTVFVAVQRNQLKRDAAS